MKIRKFLSALTAAATALQIAAFPAAAADNSGAVRAEVDYVRSEIKISGTVTEKEDVVIEVIKPSVILDDGTEYTIDPSGNLDALPEAVQEKMFDHFEVLTPEGTAFSTAYAELGNAGVYTVFAKSGSMSSAAKAQFYYDTKAASDAQLEIINGYIAAKDEANVRKFITDNTDKYFISAVFYDDAAVGDAVAAGVISDGTAKSMADLVRSVEKYSTLQRLHTASSDAETGEILLSYATELGLTAYDEYPYMTAGDAAFMTELGKRVRESEFETSAEFESAYKAAMCLTGIHNAKNYGEINPILKRAKNAGFLTKSAYFDLISTKSVDDSLVKKNYSSMKALSDAIDSLLAGNSGGNNGGSSGGSGGSGGGNGGSGSSVNVNIGANAGKPNNETTAAFSDVPDSHWAYLSILSLKKKGAINGYEDGTFKPDNSVTRREFVKIALEAFGIEDSTAVSSFGDVSADDWAYKQIAAAQAHGIISGDENGNFNGDANIIRQDVAKILYGILKFRSSTLPAERDYTGFNDYADISEYADEAIQALYRGGAINGTDDGNFMPQAYATRAETAKMIFSVLQKIGG